MILKTRKRLSNCLHRYAVNFDGGQIELHWIRFRSENQLKHQRKLSPTIRLLTPKGLGMQIQLMMGLIDLMCPVDESCSLLITDTSDTPGIAVLLQRERFVPAKRPWYMNPDPEAGLYFYNAVFERESPPEIVQAVKELLEMPGANEFPRP